MREITTEWLRLSVKADALVTEPMRMQETGCGWCLLPGQQSPSPYLLAKTLVATAHSSPMAEITVTCGEHTTCSSQSSETLHMQLALITFPPRVTTFCSNSGLNPVCFQQSVKINAWQRHFCFISRWHPCSHCCQQCQAFACRHLHLSLSGVRHLHVYKTWFKMLTAQEIHWTTKYCVTLENHVMYLCSGASGATKRSCS